MKLSTPVSNLPGIGEKYSKKLKNLGIGTVKDLLFYFPRRWDDFSKIIPTSEIKEEAASQTVKGIIWKIRNRKTKTHKTLTELIITDTTGSAEAIFYNQPYLTGILKKGDEIILAGRLSRFKNRLIFQSPIFEKVGEGKLPGFSKEAKREAGLTHVGRIVPVYSETEGLTSRWLRAKIKDLLPLCEKLSDFLPEKIRASQNLLELSVAVKELHFPQNSKSLASAKRRLAFDELFLIQLNHLKQKLDLKQDKAPSVEIKKDLLAEFSQRLPFKLTNDQRKAAWEILLDLKRPYPASRLLEGEVGSGKTLVACLAILNVAKNNYQIAYMAPTEVLASQQFSTFLKYFQPFGMRCVLLLGSTKKKEKEESLKKIRKGEVDLVVGTHALIQEQVKFKNLALAIIDEQHRFGVAQRSKLREKSGSLPHSPHLLTMTATPIPRTLALALYGDLDLSIISEMPPGRPKVITKLVAPEDREKAYLFIRKKIQEGRQSFVICPLIEESDKLGVKAATSEYEKLSSGIFPELKIGLLHGKMKTKEKEEVMEKFAKGELDILVSTPVVEVGIDVPNATIMVIEGAERFGLASLHQFRGRVGRGKYQSYCFLFTENASRLSYGRLQALLKAKDGFELSEKDMEIRGPGEIYGLHQHGLPDLKMASLTDVKLISEAKKEAESLLREDPALAKYPQLVKELERFVTTRHLE